MSDVFTDCLLVDKVNLRPADLHEEPHHVISQALKDRYECKCSRYGYIRRGSIKVKKLGLGTVQMVSLNGDISYSVQFNADVCLPVVGNVFKAIVRNMNRFAVLCEVTRDKDLVLEILVAKNSPEIQSEVNLDNLNAGDTVNVEVLGRKFELNDKKISIIGRLLANFKPSRVVQRAQSMASDASDLDDIGSGVPSDEDDDDSSEEEEESSSEEEEDDEEEESSSEEEEEEAAEEDDASSVASDDGPAASDVDDE